MSTSEPRPDRASDILGVARQPLEAIFGRDPWRSSGPVSVPAASGER
jgi:hypothetical protein